MMEKTFTCTDGFRLAAQHYPATSSDTANGNSSKKILLLHGWMDNCRSFWKLAPRLSEASNEVVALDFPGHGLSDHRPKDGPTVLLPEAVFYVADVLQQLDWTTTKPVSDETEAESNKPPQVTLIGHSMGAAISLAYAATFPDQVEQLVLLEGAGPIAKPDHDVTKHLRRHVETRLKGNVSLYGKSKGPRIHESLEAAIEARMKTATISPGNRQYLSKEAATEMVTRATRPADTNGSKGVKFLHDYRLTWPSLMYMTPAQVDALLQAISCPTSLLLAQDGWPFDDDRLEATKQGLSKYLKQFAVLPGSHHFHADPNTANVVTEHVMQFLESEE